MTKKLLVLFMMLMALSFVSAQNPTYADFEDTFGDFSSSLAGVLPSVSTIGLNWSDAYVGGGKLPPDLGVGITVGFASLPSESFEKVATLLDVPLPDELFDLGIGVPVPAYTIDARLAIPFIPIPLDAGFKLGILDPEWSESLTGGAAAVDYLLVGGDVRYAILENGVLLPDLSVGVGYNYLRGGLYVSDVVAGQTISNVEGSGFDVTVSDGDMVYEWSSNVIDIKVQASKDLLIFTPSVGAGYSFGWSTAGGGMNADVSTNATDGDLSIIEDLSGMDLSGTSLRISSENSGGSLRAWGGLSVNMLIIRLDLAATYNVTDSLWGGSLNARVQI